MDQKNVQHHHIITPDCNNTEIEQVIGKGIRVCSHNLPSIIEPRSLPLKERITIIGIVGKKGVGKDTTADILVNLYDKDENTIAIKMSFADPLKQGIAAFFGWKIGDLNNEYKKEEVDNYWGVSPRKVMQWFGTEVFRKKINELLPEVKNEEFWTKKMDLAIGEKIKNFDEEFVNPKIIVIISDVRFPNEVQYLRSFKKNSVIKVVRQSTSNNVDNHASEKSVDDIKDCDLIVGNNFSTLELFTKYIEMTLKSSIHLE